MKKPTAHAHSRSGAPPQNRQSLFGRSLMMNFSIVFLIVFAMIVLSMQMRTAMRNKEADTITSTLRSGVTQLEDQLSSVTDSLYALRDELAAAGKQSIGRYDANALNNTKSKLASIRQHNSLVAEIVLVYENTDLAITTQAVCPSINDLFFYYNMEGVNTARIRNYAGTGKFAMSEFMACTAIGWRDTALTPIAFCYAMPLDTSNFSVRRGMAYIFFSRDELLNLTVSESMQPYVAMEVANTSSDVTNIFTYRAPRADSTGLAIDMASPAAGLEFHVTVDQAFLDDALRGVDRTIMIIILLAVVGGVLLSVFSAYRQNLPWRSVIRQLSDHGLLASDNKNEYNALRSSLDRIIRDRETTSGQLAHYQESLENNMLDRLFSPAALRAEDAETLQLDLGEFPERAMVYYGKVLISSAETASSLELAAMMIFEFLRQRLPEHALLHPTDLNTFGLVYPLGDGTPEQAETQLRALLQEVPQHFSAQVVTAPGGLCSGMQTVGLLYEHGQMNYYASIERRDPTEPILQPDAAGSGDRLYLRSLLLLQQYLASGDAENAVAALETFYACPSDTRLIDIRERYSTLKTQILLTARDAAPQCTVPPLPWFSCFGGDPTKPLMALTDAVRAVAASVAEQQSTGAQDDQCRQLMEFLQANYSDSSLCATVIADEFRVSEKYLFTLFKKKTGHSPISYLHHLRMERAAALLCEGRMSVQQICEAVGMPNLGTFQKAFKREYGVAPSRYRDFVRRKER